MLHAPDIDPIIFGNPLNIRWYSLMYVIGLLVVYANFRSAINKGRLTASVDQIETLMVVGLIGMILGARSFYILFYSLHHYIAHPKEIFAVWEGGLSFHGAMFGVCTALAIYCKKVGFSFLQITDEISTVIPIGLFFGRIGNFINQELWGRVTDMPWGVIFRDAGQMPRHPSQIYEAIGEGLLILLIVQVLKKRHLPIGAMSGAFMMSYSAVRFVIEFFREPDLQLGFVLGPFSMGQLLCAGLWVVGMITMLYGIRNKHATS